MLGFERLKELKAEFEQVRKYNDRHCMSTVTDDDVIEVLDEAIARQSVKSEEVAEAIEYLEPLTEYSIMSGNFAKHLKTAITALQAYEPTISKMETVEKVAISKTETTSCELLNHNMNYKKCSSCNYLIHVYVNKPNYCPACGRKLN